MWRTRRQVEDLAGADRNIAPFAVILHAQHHLAFELIKKLRTFVPVVIAARVRAADNHHDEIAVHDAFVADRRLQQVSVLVDPALQVDGRQERHASMLAFLESGVRRKTATARHAAGAVRVAAMRRCNVYGISTLSITKITPLDCITSGMVMCATSPLSSLTSQPPMSSLPTWIESPSTVFRPTQPPFFAASEASHALV